MFRLQLNMFELFKNLAILHFSKKILGFDMNGPSLKVKLSTKSGAKLIYVHQFKVKMR